MRGSWVERECTRDYLSVGDEVFLAAKHTPSTPHCKIIDTKVSVVKARLQDACRTQNPTDDAVSVYDEERNTKQPSPEQGTKLNSTARSMAVLPEPSDLRILRTKVGVGISLSLSVHESLYRSRRVYTVNSNPDPLPQPITTPSEHDPPGADSVSLGSTSSTGIVGDRCGCKSRLRK